MDRQGRSLSGRATVARVGRTAVENGFCAECGKQLGEPTGTPMELRKPCTNCGSLNRMAKLEIVSETTPHGDLGLKARTPGEKKPFLEQKTGASYWRKMGKWMRRVQIIDRRGNRYVKRVEDPDTGEVVRNVDEPLTDHRGYGSAKRT
jgi:hypothetical protein